MRTRTRLATVMATGVVATALLASPNLASGQRGGDAADQAVPTPQTSQAASTCDGTGTGPGTGQKAEVGDRAGARQSATGQRTSGQRTTGQGQSASARTQADLTDVASGTLTEDQKLVLSAIAEDEKVAHDLYAAFADACDVRVFTRIAAAETQHLDAVRILLDRYDITDPTIGLEAGTFASASFQDLYDAQLAAGSASLQAAYAVGEVVETIDLDYLTDATVGVTAPDVLQVYTNLLAASERHLAAFTR